MATQKQLLDKNISKLAVKILAKYRLYRKMGYSPKLARTNAYFTNSCLSGGRQNLFVVGMYRRYELRKEAAKQK